MPREDDPRSRLAVGLELATRVSTVGLEFALPVAAGFFADAKLGTKGLGVVTGSVAGLVLGMVGAVGLARQVAGPPRKARTPGPTPPRGGDGAEAGGRD